MVLTESFTPGISLVLVGRRRLGGDVCTSLHQAGPGPRMYDGIANALLVR